jgi:hypothetical protein
VNEKPFEKRDFGLAVDRKIADSPRAMHRYLPLCLSLGLLVAFRAAGSMMPYALPNFQALVALFFCGSLLAPGWRGFAIPFGIWALTYPLGIGPVSSIPLFITTLIALAATYFMGVFLSKRGLPVALVGSVAAALVFHLITNTAAWIGSPMYEKSLLGFWQSIWAGPLGSPLPSWVFLRNLAIANALFTGIFLVAQLRMPRLAPQLSASLPVK